MLRTASAYIGRELPFCATRVGTCIKEGFFSLSRHVQARWNRLKELVDQERLEGVKELTLLERISLVELLQQSTHIPLSLQSIVFDERLKKQFFTMEEQWNSAEWDAYRRALLIAYTKLTAEEKRHITPVFFLSLPEHVQARIRNCLKGSREGANEGDIEQLVHRFNELPLHEKQRIDSLSVDEFLRLSAERQKDLLALLVLAKRGNALSGHTLYEKYQSSFQLARKELEVFLSHFSTLRETDFACLTPSQALRLSPHKLEHVIDLLHTYKRGCLDELASSHGMVYWCSDWETLKKHLLLQLKRQREISHSSPSELPFAVRLARDIVEHIAILFSSLNVSEREELLSLTRQEMEHMSGDEQCRFLALFQAHIEEWKGKEAMLFSSYAAEKAEPCLSFVNMCLKKLRSQKAEPPPSLSAQEACTLVSFFNATVPLFRSDCRMHMEEQNGCLTDQQVSVLMKDIEAIDSLYKSSLHCLIKIQLSAGHFLKEAIEAQDDMKKQEEEGTLTYVEKEAFIKAIALHQSAKNERLKEKEQYQLLMNHLLVKREEKIRLLELQGSPIPPLPFLTHEEIREIIGIFSPLVEEFKERECTLVQELFEKTLQQLPSLAERRAFARAQLEQNGRALQLAEARVNENRRSQARDEPSDIDKDKALLTLYHVHITSEIDLFVLAIARKKQELFLESMRKISLSLDD